MKAEATPTPGYLDRYVFYTRGKVPPGHEDWARQRLGLARWTGMLLAFEGVVWLGVYVAALVLSGGFNNLWGVWIVACLFAALAPVSAARCRARVKRSLETS